MIRTVLILTISTLAMASQTVLAGWVLGTAAHTAWSDNEYLGDPNGFGLYATKSLSGKLDVRGSYTRLDHDSRYIGILPMNFLEPPGPWSVRQFISTSASVDLYEVSLLYGIVEGSKMRLEIGAGMGFGRARIKLSGEQSGHVVKGRNDPFAVSMSVQILVKELVQSPLALRLGYQYRSLSAPVFTTDGFEPFTDFTLSSVQLSVLARF